MRSQYYHFPYVAAAHSSSAVSRFSCSYNYVNRKVYSTLSLIRLGTVQRGRNSEVAAFQKIAAAKNDLTSNIMAVLFRG